MLLPRVFHFRPCVFSSMWQSTDACNIEAAELHRNSALNPANPTLEAASVVFDRAILAQISNLLPPLRVQLHLTIPRGSNQRDYHPDSIQHAHPNIKQHNPKQNRQRLLQIRRYRNRQRTR